MSHSRGAHDPDFMPPAGFPVYGLVSALSGPRWLELFGDPPDGSPTWVSLNHLSEDGLSLVNVTTHLHRVEGNPRGYRVPTDEQAAEQGRSPLQSVAEQGTNGLIGRTLPVRRQPRPPGFLRALVDRQAEAASAYASWPTADWLVDGIPVKAPVWRFAGGWTAFTDAAVGVYLVVVGIGLGAEPEGLSFAPLRDGRSYHFNLAEPLSFDVVRAAAEAAGVPDGSDPPWEHHDWHPDQLQLMR
jgi:hypothetical protein